LEGVDAVVSAAEEEQSPAILQVGNTLQALSDLA
jgi:fructose/tagatose bisphosphate aldolase